MVGAVLVYSARGDLIVSRIYKPTLKRSIADVFRVQIINNLDVRSPILTLGSTTFHFIRSNNNNLHNNSNNSGSNNNVTNLNGLINTTNMFDIDNINGNNNNGNYSGDTNGNELWLVTVSRNNDSSASIWEFLYKLNDMLLIYGINNEYLLMDDFMTCYEILNCMVSSGGIITFTDISDIIKQMSSQPKENYDQLLLMNKGSSRFGNIHNRNHNNILNETNITRLPKILKKPSTLSIPSPTRGKKNEIILQVIEKISILVSKDGSILKSYVDGTIDLTTTLKDEPSCQFGINDNSIQLNDFKFHSCVSIDNFERNHLIKFRPPMGSIELMKYHCRENLNLPFKLTPIVTQVSGNFMDYKIIIKSLFPNKLSAKNVILKIPVPPGTIDCKTNCTNGSCNFDPTENLMIWRLNKFNGLTENTMSAITVPTKDITAQDLQQWPRPSMSLDFEIMMFSNSGLVVRYFTINNSTRNINKWIKYLSKSGSYEIRY